MKTKFPLLLGKSKIRMYEDKNDISVGFAGSCFTAGTDNHTKNS